ncbi:MAG: hypothetical protein GY787_15665, partial [Alteromonadales bacterium]|nr:hypothetical protein [Alteromonadales bacterium]
FAGWPEDVNAKGLRYVYDIPSGQLTTYPSLNAYRFFVLPDDTILAFHGKSITLYTFDNKKIRDIAMPQGIDFINEQMVASGNGQFALINTDTNQRLFSFDGYKFKHIQIGKRFPPAARAMVNNQGQVYEEDAYRLYSHIPEKKLLINIKPVFDNNIRFNRSIIINEQSLLLPLNNKNMTHDK